jgi:hypothetical protein
MKKTLILALVLSMVSMANAALQISVNGDTLITDVMTIPSDVLVLGIATDSPMGFGLGDWNGAALTCTINSTIDASNAVSLYPNEPGIAIFRDAAVDLGFIVPTYPQDNGPGFTFTFTGANIPAGMIIDSIMMHCNSPILTVVTLWGSQDYEHFEVLDTLYVWIPEPMTLGLLGLGGLFIRRRK